VTEEQKRYVLIGTAGHIDHGKTALVKMLTGCETDTLREEKERGLTIDLGFAPCELRGDLMACIVDVPGHEKFIRNMVAGASGIDAVLLVVAADDSVMPQTREHLRIVELLGIRHGLVAVTKIDMVDEELREMVVEEVRELLEDTFLKDAAICPVSSVTGEGLEELWLRLTDVVDASRDRPVTGIFQMPVERVFSLQGFGTVMTGMPLKGRLEVGDSLELLPHGQKGRVRGLQVYGKTSNVGWAGQCLALNVSDVNHSSAVRGNVLATPGYLTPARMAEVHLKLLPGAERPLKHQAPVRFHTGTAEIMGRMFLLDRDVLSPGESTMAQFRAEEDLIVSPGDRFVIRQYSPVVTIGGGRILRSRNRKVKRFREGVIAELSALFDVLDDEPGRVGWLLDQAGRTPVKPEDLLSRAGVPRPRLLSILEDLVSCDQACLVGKGEAWIAADTANSVGAEVAVALKRIHDESPLRAGADPLLLRDEIEADPAVIDVAVTRLVSAGTAEWRDGRLALVTHQVRPTAADEDLCRRVSESLANAGIAPSRVSALAGEVGVAEDRLRAVLSLLDDRDQVVRMNDDIYADAGVAAATKKRLVDYLTENEKIGVVDFRDLISASRKHVYAWLDYFDESGVTFRAENLRFLR
jgi:selenocysteine-specific elongation factor